MEKMYITYLKNSIPPLLVLIFVVCIHYTITYVVLEPTRRFLLPPPHSIIYEGFFVPKHRDEIIRGLLITTKVSLIGLSIAYIIGFITALLMSQAKWIERSLYPWAVFTQTVPILALVPIIGFWFGFDILARIIVVVIISIFPIIINTLTGLRGASSNLHDLLTLHNATRWTRATKLMIPYSLPDMFTGLRTSAGLAIIGSIVGDIFFGRGSPGLGMLLKAYGQRLRTEELLSATLVSCLLGITVFWCFSYMGRKLVGHWSESWSS